MLGVNGIREAFAHGDNAMSKVYWCFGIPFGLLAACTAIMPCWRSLSPESLTVIFLTAMASGWYVGMSVGGLWLSNSKRILQGISETKSTPNHPEGTHRNYHELEQVVAVGFEARDCSPHSHAKTKKAGQSCNPRTDKLHTAPIPFRLTSWELAEILLSPIERREQDG